MAKVVTRGESVYSCDQCSRNIRVPANRVGIEVMQRCTITHGCRGSLRRLTQIKDIVNTPAFPPEVQGVQDWFQRRVLYTHTQPVEAQTWRIVHNLANKPTVHAFVYAYVRDVLTLIPETAFTVATVDMNTIDVSFERPVSGVIQCITLASQNSTNPTHDLISSASDVFAVTTTSGELTIATLDASPIVNVTVRYNSSEPIEIVYANIDDASSINSPWAGASRIVANGRTYVLRSFDIVDHQSQEFANGQILNGTPLSITQIDGVDVRLNDVLFLLARAPYSAVDRITTEYMDAARSAGAIFYDTGRAYTQQQNLRPVYPPITVV